jgi:hypothetical protein
MSGGHGMRSCQIPIPFLLLFVILFSCASFVSAAPTEDAALKTFEADLNAYGMAYGRLQASVVPGAQAGFVNEGTRLFKTKSARSGICPGGASDEVKVERVSIQPNEDDHYPYVVTITFLETGHCFRKAGGPETGFANPPQRGSATYLYGAKGTWKRKG